MGFVDSSQAKKGPDFRPVPVKSNISRSLFLQAIEDLGTPGRCRSVGRSGSRQVYPRSQIGGFLKHGPWIGPINLDLAADACGGHVERRPWYLANAVGSEPAVGDVAKE